MSWPKIEFFYSPMCSICPQVKAVVRSVVEKSGVDYEEINFHSVEGEIRAKNYRIDTVPCLIINGQQKISNIVSEETLLTLLKEITNAD